MQDVHFAWLARHSLTMQDAWRAERAAFACEQDMEPLVQLAALDFDNVADGVDSLLLKWGYVLHVQTVYSRSAPVQACLIGSCH